MRSGSGMAARAAVTALAMITSPALSYRAAWSGSTHSGVEYSGWAWSTYSRAPLVSTTLTSPVSSSGGNSPS